MIAGSNYGLAPDIVAFRAYDGSYLRANKGGDNAAGERGEVYVDMASPTPDRNWSGWWRIGEVLNDPPPGSDIWTALGDGVRWGVLAVRDGIGFWFNKDPAMTDGGTTGGTTASSPLSCSNLPPVTPSDTAHVVHAYCEGVIPSDFSGTFYPENDSYQSLRIDCDIEAHHRLRPTHAVIHQACDVGGSNGPGCESVNHVVDTARHDAPTPNDGPAVGKPSPDTPANRSGVAATLPPAGSSAVDQPSVGTRVAHWFGGLFRTMGHFFTGRK